MGWKATLCFSPSRILFNDINLLDNWQGTDLKESSWKSSIFGSSRGKFQTVILQRGAGSSDITKIPTAINRLLVISAYKCMSKNGINWWLCCNEHRGGIVFRFFSLYYLVIGQPVFNFRWFNKLVLLPCVGNGTVQQTFHHICVCYKSYFSKPNCSYTTEFVFTFLADETLLSMGL